MTSQATGAEAYYANFGGKSVAEYVTEDILASPTQMDRLRYAVRLVPDTTTSLLDVGAGPGVFLHLLRQERGLEGVGVELTPGKVDYARTALQLDVRVGSADRLPFDAGTFDAVTAFEVIEHLPYGVYEASIAEMCRVAKRHVIVAVPYRERRIMVRCPYCATRFHPHYHMRSFDDASLTHLAPALRLQRLEMHGEIRELVWPASALYAAKVARAGLPPYALCPGCGYRASAAGAPAAGESRAIPRRRSLSSLITRWIPRVSKPRWAFAVYEKA